VLRLQQVRACVLDDATLGQVQNAECDLSHWEIAAIPNFPALPACAAGADGTSYLYFPVPDLPCRRFCGVSASIASIPSDLASRRRVARPGSSERKADVI
jgi:hypothetical protein